MTKKVATGVSREIRQAFHDMGSSRVRLKGMRFIPSTKVDLGQGAFQVMANTIVEVSRPGGLGKRSESVDSVVTIDTQGSGQVLKAVKIPALDAASVAKA